MYYKMFEDNCTKYNEENTEFISVEFSILLTNVILSIEWITMNVLKQNLNL